MRKRHFAMALLVTFVLAGAVTLRSFESHRSANKTAELMFRIITIEREYGCGAAEIAKQLASRLGWKLWDRELTEEIARVAKVDTAAVCKCDERMDGAFQRLVKVFWRGSYERSTNLDFEHSFDADRMVEIGEEVMREIASRGNCVIVGRGAPYHLRERRDAFHVFMPASLVW